MTLTTLDPPKPLDRADARSPAVAATTLVVGPYGRGEIANEIALAHTLHETHGPTTTVLSARPAHTAAILAAQFGLAPQACAAEADLAARGGFARVVIGAGVYDDPEVLRSVFRIARQQMRLAGASVVVSAISLPRSAAIQAVLAEPEVGEVLRAAEACSVRDHRTGEILYELDLGYAPRLVPYPDARVVPDVDAAPAAGRIGVGFRSARRVAASAGPLKDKLAELFGAPARPGRRKGGGLTFVPLVSALSAQAVAADLSNFAAVAETLELKALGRVEAPKHAPDAPARKVTDLKAAVLGCEAVITDRDLVAALAAGSPTRVIGVALNPDIWVLRACATLIDSLAAGSTAYRFT